MAGNGLMDSQDSQNTRLEIDIGDNKTMTIEITLRGRLTLQSTVDLELPLPAAIIPIHAEEEDSAVEDQESLDKMRGYLMVVCTLLMGIAFQAGMQPPSWMPNDWYQVYKRGQDSEPSPAADSSTTTYAQASQARSYMLFNAMNFAVPLVLLLVLLQRRSPPTHFIQMVTQQLSILCSIVAYTFVAGCAGDPDSSWYFYLIIYSYVACTALHLLALRGRDIRLRSQMAEAGYQVPPA